MSANHPQARTENEGAELPVNSFYPLILDSLGEAICMFDPRGEMTWQNKACLSLCSNISREAHTEFFFSDYFTKTELDKFRQQLYIALGGKRSFFEWSCREYSRHFIFELRPLRSPQQVIGVLCMIWEDRSAAPEKITHSDDTRHATLQRVTDAFIALDKDWHYTYVNDKAAELHGRDAADLLGKLIWDEYPDVKKEPFYYHLQRAFQTQQPQRLELYYTAQDKWFEDFIYPSQDGVVVYYRDITVQKKAEELLIKSEEQYRSLVEQAGDAIIIADIQGRCLDFNSTAEKLTGYTKQELYGLNMFSLLVIEAGEPSIRMAELMDNKSVLQERQIRRKDGSLFYAELSSKLLTGGRILVIGRDISDRKLMEQALLDSESRYRTLFEEGPDGVCFYNTATLRYLAVNKRMAELFGYTQREFESLNVLDIALPEELKNNPPKFTDLPVGKTVINERVFKRKNGDLIFIETTTKRLSEETCVSFMRDISDRKKVEDAIRENELRWKLALDNSELGVWEMNFEKKTAFISEKTREQTGYLYEQHINDPDFWFNAIYIEDRAEAVQKFVDTLKGLSQGLDATFRVVCKDGTLKWFRFTGKVVSRSDKGFALRIIGIHEHITERIEAQARLKKSETIFREITEHSPSGLVLLNKEGKLTYISESARRITGYTIEDVTGKDPASLTHPDDLPDLLSQLVKLQSEPAYVFTAQYRFLYKDGSWRYVESTFSNLLHIKDVEAISINFHDIDEERNARIRLQLLTKASNDAVWDWDLVQDTIWWNDSYFNLLGFDPEGPVPPLPEWIRKVHPDDRDKIVSRFQRIRKNQVDSWQDDFRYLQEEGSWGTVLDRAFVIRNNQGKPTRVVGALVDITQQKAMEEKLQYEKMLSDSLIQKIPGIFYLYTREGKFLRWNKNMETLTGYTGTELRNMHPLDLFEGNDKAIIQERIKHHFHESLPPVEVNVLTKHRKKMPVYINSMAIIYEGIPCVVGIGSDISTLQLAQQALVESEEAFTRLFRESGEPILLFEGTNMVDCNDATVKMLGYESREDILFLQPWKISPRKQPDGSTSIEKTRRMLKEALEKGYNRFEWVHRKANGDDFTVEVMMTPIFMKGRQLFYVIWRDVTEWKKAEAALQLSNKTISDYKYAIDQSTIVSFSDAEGNITYVNDNFVQLYGYSKDEIIGVNHRILNSGVHPDSFWRNFWLALSKGKVFKADVCNKAKDGTIHWADTTIVPFLDDKGKPYQYLAIRSDITEKRKLEKELKERERAEQNRITETALEAQERERNFLGQELHDNVNQILVGTKLLLNVVQDNPEANREILDACVRNIQQAIDENRKLSHTLATPDMKQQSLSIQLTALAENMFYSKQIKVSFIKRGYKDERLDEKQKISLYRIAQEQCTNIIKYAQATRVEFLLKMNERVLELRITDNGIGTSNETEKDGIGLRNIKGRVGLYGGNMEIITSPGNGFALVVTLPLK